MSHKNNQCIHCSVESCQHHEQDGVCGLMDVQIAPKQRESGRKLVLVVQVPLVTDRREIFRGGSCRAQGGAVSFGVFKEGGMAHER